MAAMAIGTTAHAAEPVQVPDFDTVSSGGYYAQIPNGYNGVDWDNFYALDAVNYGTQGTNGYTNGLVSGRNVAFNAFGNPAAIHAGGSSFTLKDGYFTAAWNNGLTIDVVGKVNGTDTYYKSFVVDTLSPLHVIFDWAGLSDAVFTSSGGVSAGYFGSGNHFALDNVSFGAPEINGGTLPLALMLLVLGAVALERRRRAAAA
ncbi:hypothetical protein HHL27_03990 [Novosphingobium sp. TW-4]|uniref:PEP-CTERM sorting domain-containing protein n=1 Tax=Novosphingobium olei TaxID=2728851 RepID=A0A7Y0BM40_9SPHN|nr:hypothetical protein [Novosphingobium olei]